jgi:hypothetical protein
MAELSDHPDALPCADRDRPPSCDPPRATKRAACYQPSSAGRVAVMRP